MNQDLYEAGFRHSNNSVSVGSIVRVKQCSEFDVSGAARVSEVILGERGTPVELGLEAFDAQRMPPRLLWSPEPNSDDYDESRPPWRTPPAKSGWCFGGPFAGKREWPDEVVHTRWWVSVFGFDHQDITEIVKYPVGSTVTVSEWRNDLLVTDRGVVVCSSKGSSPGRSGPSFLIVGFDGMAKVHADWAEQAQFMVSWTWLKPKVNALGVHRVAIYARPTGSGEWIDQRGLRVTIAKARRVRK